MKSLDRTRRLLALGLVVAVALLGFQVSTTAATHAAPARTAGTQPAAFPSVDQFKGNAASYHPTPAQRAYAADKSRLADEYAHQVLTGRETLAVYESHYRAFMIKWKLGDVANLHAALTRGTARLRANAAHLAPNCPTVAGGPQVLCPVWAAQFPEEHYNWCGPATLSTTVVENSWNWPGANTYGSETITYNAYVVTQPSDIATNDEYWLATHGVISGDVYNNGTSVNQMTTVLNEFTNGHGGNYAQDWFPTSEPENQQIADFQNKVSSDIGTGWDVPTGIYIGAGNFSSMPGYPYSHNVIDHYVPVTFISSDHNTTYYSDPVYAAPAYSGWSVPAPYESTSTSNIVWWTQVILW